MMFCTQQIHQSTYQSILNFQMTTPSLLAMMPTPLTHVNWCLITTALPLFTNILSKQPKTISPSLEAHAYQMASGPSHSTLYNPTEPPHTLPAMSTGHFITWPNLTTQVIRLFLLKSPATSKGHINQQCQCKCNNALSNTTDHDCDTTIPSHTHTIDSLLPLISISFLHFFFLF